MSVLKVVEPVEGRAYPHDIGIERLILGACLLEPGLFAIVRELLRAEHFYFDEHRKIWRRMEQLYTDGCGFEPELFGDISAIALALCDGSYRTTELPQLCGKLVAVWRRRERIKGASQLEDALFENNEAAADIASERLRELSESGVGLNFELWDIGDIAQWPVTQLKWAVEPIIPDRGIGFMSAPPKDGKSLLASDLCIHLAHAFADPEIKWLGKFPCAPLKVLYVAREDPARRIKERGLEINAGYGLGPLPQGKIFFVIRDRFSLVSPEHRAWLTRIVRQHQFEFLILDVLGRMIPELDESSAKDMAQMVTLLEELNRDLDLTILLLDHTRKPQGLRAGRNQQEPNPFDLKGSVAKYGCADFMICLSRTQQPGRLQLYCENKDTDERPHFFVDVSPKGSGLPKFRWAGDVGKMADEMKAVGDANRKKILDVLGDTGASTPEIARQTSLKESTVRKHLGALLDSGEVDSTGKARNCRWFKSAMATKQARSGFEGSAL